eukprot:524333-Pelagomonas_calceolata.AAC.1
MLPLCRLQLLSRPRVFTVLNFNQVHMPLVPIQLVGLPHAVGCCGEGTMQAVYLQSQARMKFVNLQAIFGCLAEQRVCRWMEIKKGADLYPYYPGRTGKGVDVVVGGSGSPAQIYMHLPGKRC